MTIPALEISFHVVIPFQGVCTLQCPYMDDTMVVFHVFLRYKKVNKIKFIEVIKKRDSLI
jgi:hypothetical protein